MTSVRKSAQDRRSQKGDSLEQATRHEMHPAQTHYDEKIVWRRVNPEGRILLILSFSLVVLLGVITAYAVLSGDREILLAILEILKLAIPSLFLGAATKMAWRKWSKGETMGNANNGTG